MWTIWLIYFLLVHFIPADEHLDVYLVVRIPYTVAGRNQAAEAKTLFEQLDIHVEAAILDSTNNTSPPRTFGIASETSLPKQIAQKRESTRGPIENPPYYTQSFNARQKEDGPEILSDEDTHCCLYQMSIPVGM